MLADSQWWPEARLLAWQRQHLQLLLAHARATVPFYGFRLNKVFRAGGGIDWERWNDIPILRRADLAARGEALLSRAPIAEHGPFHDVQSSGSTGDPVTMRSTRWLHDVSLADNWRAHEWAGLDWSKTVLASMGRDDRRVQGEVLGPWGPAWDERARRGRLVYSHYGADQDTRIRLCRESGASYHATTAYSGGMTAERAIETGSDLRLEAILARGGAVTEALRATVRQGLGAEIVEFYSSKEAGAIAQRCPEGSLHVNAESVLVEIVDETGRPVAEGESGRLVVTPFASTAMPLIRYDQGDVVVRGGACKCGRCLPTIAAISGRERSAFIHPDGRRILRDLPFEAYRLIGAARIQVAQVAATRFEVRYTPRDWTTPRDEAAFVAIFRGLYFAEAQLTFVEMADLPVSPSGKFMSNVVEWTPGP